MLFNFALSPLADISPWGPQENPSLSWFGLTEGQYWIQTEPHTLLEYDDRVQALGVTRYCGYQVARLHEDLMDMLPYILEPVPVALTQYISVATNSDWQRNFAAWCDKYDRHLDLANYRKVLDNSIMWKANRKLDLAYLSPAADIWIWSDALNVHIEWDNTGKLVNGQPAWTASQGACHLPRARFMAEVHEFHWQLMTQMQNRVDSIRSGACFDRLHIDIDQLANEQKQRELALELALGFKPHTPWQWVQDSSAQILGAKGYEQASPRSSNM